MKNIDQVRKNFPYLNNGVIYFNHASLGPLSQSVSDRINDFIYQRSIYPIDNFEFFIQSSQSAKEKLGCLLNCKSDRIAWINNVSDGLSILVNSLNLNKDSRIILFEDEFPSNVYPFLNLQKKGIQIDFVKHKNYKFTIEDISEKITKQTKLLSISAVQFLSGYKCDLNAIGKLCSDNNIIFCVDAIQATGVVNLDVVKAKIDFLIGGSQKWLMALQGTSYFYISKSLQSRLNQQNVGWTSVKNTWDLTNYDLSLKDDAARFQNGTLNSIGITALDESLKLFMEFGIDKIASTILTNTLYFRKKLKESGLKLLLENSDENELAGITTIFVNHPEKTFQKLSDNRIYCSLREGKIRFAPHFYNTTEEIDIVIEKLNK
jgi:cysteine desulfurase/selenocysteine lyase